MEINRWRVLARLFLSAAVVVVLTPLASCDDIDRAADCNYICERYADCFDESYDVDSCAQSCEASQDEDPHSADECEACIDDRSCSGSVFPCAAECSSIVP